MVGKMADDIADKGIVVIFGGGGFVGRQTAQALLTAGYRVRIAQRDPSQAYRVKPLGGLGQVQAIAADVTKPDSVARAVAGAKAVINLVGVLKGPMQAVHVDGARHVAQAAKRADVHTLVHMSAIGADVASASAYGRTKGEGEKAVRDAFPAATIVRPSLIFGRDDQFTNRFAGMIASTPIIPIVRADTRFQPVFVGDVASAILAALIGSDQCAGKTFTLGGPDVMTMRDILQWIAVETCRHPRFVALPDGIARNLAQLTGWMPGAPITSDQFRMLESDNVVGGAPHQIADLGITPTPLLAVAPEWLERYRKHGRFSTRVSA